MHQLPELKSAAQPLFDQFASLRGRLDLDTATRRLDEIEKQLAAEGAWDKPETLTPVLKEKSRLEGECARFERLESARRDVEDWLALAEEEASDELLEQLFQSVAFLRDQLEQAEIQMLLSDDEDQLPAIMEIHPGAGGTEAQDWAAMLLRMYQRWADKHDCKSEFLDYQNGDEAGIKSVTLRLTGPNVYGLLKGEKGIHRLIRISPFDSSGRRHTSFASVDVLPDAGQDISISIDENDLRIDVFRAGGAGGQHVNKTNSAVRITHLPTGIVVQCQNEKSQHSNKDAAMSVLKARLYERELQKLAAEKKNQYQDKDAINFGSQIRTYTMQPYRLIKDHRSNGEDTDVDGVLDGNLDKLIRHLLLYRHAQRSS
ncbi:peptide chain release factor 2 [Desulfovibrio sp. OttesenSCG-928-M16]|nr:peptide chain release factor 2 [Desulfovibrio sp. OttesenSCG-928-M16]